MDGEDLEEFLSKNNLIANQSNQCVFCSIVFGDIPSHKIDENSEAIVVLEINPISKGHSIIIPKKHGKEGSVESKETTTLIKKISKLIVAKLKPKKIEISTSNMFGHDVVNILPVYTDETFNSRRQPARKEELEEVEKLLKAKPKLEKTSKAKTPKRKKSIVKEIVEKFEQKLWLPQRIP